MDFSGGTSDKRDTCIDFVSALIRSINLDQTSAHDDIIEASQAARSKGIESKAVFVENENIPPDTKQIIAITGDPLDTYSSKDFKKLQSLFDEYSRRCKL